MSWSEESTDGTKTGTFRRIIDHPRYNNKCGIDSGTIQKLQFAKDCCVDSFNIRKTRESLNRCKDGEQGSRWDEDEHGWRGGDCERFDQDWVERHGCTPGDCPYSFS